MHPEQIRKKFFDELYSGKLLVHHQAKRKGYVSLRDKNIVYLYNGRFGKGYVVKIPYVFDLSSNKSKRYYTIVYYIYA